MVSVWFGKDRQSLYDIDAYFDVEYDTEWFNDPFVKEMVKGIDDSDVISGDCIMSPVFGQIPPSRLSGGVKTCICLYKDKPEDYEFYPNLTLCGENCEPYLAEIFRRVDCKVACSGFNISFMGYDGQMSGLCLNTGVKINSFKDWRDHLWMVRVYER